MNEVDVDVVVLLREQHQTVRTLMSSIMTAPPSARAASFEPLVRLLAVHETAEEMVVYPALAKAADGEGQRIIEARKAEEDEAKKVLADLEKLDPASSEFAMAFAAFAQSVEAHASAEEREVFSLLSRSCSAEDLRAMGVRLQVAEGIAPTHAHKAAPESAIGNMLVGPFVAMVDRARDLFADVTSSSR